MPSLCRTSVHRPRRKRPHHIALTSAVERRIGALAERLARRFEAPHEVPAIKKVGLAVAANVAREHGAVRDLWKRVERSVKHAMTAHLRDRVGEPPLGQGRFARAASLDAPAFRGASTTRHEVIGARIGSAEDQLTDKQVRQLMLRELSKLERVVFGLMALDERSEEEVALELNRSVADVRSILAAAQKKLSRALS